MPCGYNYYMQNSITNLHKVPRYNDLTCLSGIETRYLSTIQAVDNEPVGHRWFYAVPTS